MGFFPHTNTFKGLIAILLVVRTSIMSVVMRHLQQSKAASFHPPSVVFICEFLKLSIWCLVILFSGNITTEQTTQDEPSSTTDQKWFDEVFKRAKHIKGLVFSKESLPFILPASLYACSTLFTVLSLKFIDSAHFVLLSQIRLLLTAGLSKMLFSRSFTRLQWVSLALLSVGVAIAQVGGATSPLTNATLGGDHFWKGTSFALLTVFCGSLAGVVAEILLKGTTLTLPERSIQLCIFSTFTAAFLLLADMFRTGKVYPLFENFSPWLWFILSFEIVGGFLMALMLRFGSSLLRSIASCFNLFLTTLLSRLIWPEYQPTKSFVIGGIVVTSSTLLYFTQIQQTNQKESERKKD